MSGDANYFLVTGGVVKERLDDFFKIRKAQFEARNAFTKEFGATGSYGKPSGLIGLQFLKVPVPEGWLKIHDALDCYKPRRSKATVPIIDRGVNFV